MCLSHSDPRPPPRPRCTLRCTSRRRPAVRGCVREKGPTVCTGWCTGCWGCEAEYKVAAFEVMKNYILFTAGAGIGAHLTLHTSRTRSARPAAPCSALLRPAASCLPSRGCILTASPEDMSPASLCTENNNTNIKKKSYAAVLYTG